MKRKKNWKKKEEAKSESATDKKKRGERRGGEKSKNMLLEHSWSNKQMQRDMKILGRI